VSSVSFWYEADFEGARIGATPNVRFAAASLKGRLAAEGSIPEVQANPSAGGQELSVNPVAHFSEKRTLMLQRPRAGY